MTSSSTVCKFYDLTEKDALGSDFSFSNFAGKVVYGVNVASECGDTAAGYDLLANLSKLKSKGVEVALFPCNQFDGQEPGTAEEVATFCTARGVQSKNVFEKADVNGENTRPVYRFLREQGVIVGDVSWNFVGKFLVDRQGNVHAVKDPENVVNEVLALLGEEGN